MRHGNRTLALALMLGLATWSETVTAAGDTGAKAAPDSVAADSSVASMKAPLHGGVLRSADEDRFEAVFAAEGLQVYLYTQEGAPAMVGGATGRALVTFAGGKPVEVPLVMEIPSGKEPAIFFCPMHPEVVQMRPGICTKCGGMKLYTQNRLFGLVDLSLAKPGSVTAEVTLQGVTGRQNDATFTVSNAAAKARIPGSAGAGAKPGPAKRANSGKTVKPEAPKDAGVMKKTAK
jgi:hypothetical protein